MVVSGGMVMVDRFVRVVGSNLRPRVVNNLSGEHGTVIGMY